MIKNIYLLAVSALLFGSVFTSCEMKEELVGDKKVPTDTGYLELGLGLKEGESSRVTNEEIVSAFPVVITNTDPSLSSTNHSFSSFETMTNPLVLPVGTYTVEAYSPEEFATIMSTPYYKGAYDLTITKGITSDVQVVCKMLNTKIQMTYSDEFKAEFQSWDITFDDGKSNILAFSSTTPDKTCYYWYLGETGVSTLRMNITAYTTDGVKVTDVKSFTKADAGVSYDDDNDNFIGGDQLYITLNPIDDDGGSTEPDEPEQKPTIGFDVDINITFTESGESGTVEIPVEDAGSTDGGGTSDGGTQGSGDSDEDSGQDSGANEITISDGGTGYLTNGVSVVGSDYPDDVAIEMNVPLGIEHVYVKLETTDETFEGLAGGMGLTTGDGIDLADSDDDEVQELGNLFDLPEKGDKDYSFSLSDNLFNLMGGYLGTHSFIVKVVDQEGNEKSVTLSVTLNE